MPGARVDLEAPDIAAPGDPGRPLPRSADELGGIIAIPDDPPPTDEDRPMSTSLVVLAVLMFAVTYPTRALGLLTPGLDRLPRWAFDYLQLVGPAVLAALAAVA